MILILSLQVWQMEIMDLEIEDNYQGEFLPIQDAMHKILDSLNNILSKINFTAEKSLI